MRSNFAALSHLDGIVTMAYNPGGKPDFWNEQSNNLSLRLVNVQRAARMRNGVRS